MHGEGWCSQSYGILTCQIKERKRNKKNISQRLRTQISTNSSRMRPAPYHFNRFAVIYIIEKKRFIAVARPGTRQVLFNSWFLKLYIIIETTLIYIIMLPCTTSHKPLSV